MGTNRSAISYQRLKNTRKATRVLPDLNETALPRYQKLIAQSHRRGQKRIDRWMQNA